MPTKAKSPNGSVDVLSGLRLPPVHEWVECELDDVNEALTRPLRIKVLVNPPRTEVVALAQAVQRVIEDGGQDRELFDLIAPRITQWNLQAENGDGEVVDVPPPAEAPGAIEILPIRAQSYLLRIVQAAHLGGDARSKLSRRPAATESGEAEKTPSGPQIVPTPTTATHQNHRKSS